MRTVCPARSRRGPLSTAIPGAWPSVLCYTPIVETLGGTLVLARLGVGMDGALGGLPTLLAARNGASHPDDVARALLDGPGAILGATSAAVLWARPPHLVMLGSHGFAEPEEDGFTIVPLAVDYPLTRAYWEAEAIIDPIDEVADRYVDMPLTEPSWAHYRDRVKVGTIASVPLMSQGAVIGTFAFGCAGKTDWSSVDIALLDAVGAALGLWLTHPASGVPRPMPIAQPPNLTARQLRIVRLLADGRSNTSIASVLEVSTSTVKQEVGRVLSAFAVSNRTAAVDAARASGLLAPESTDDVDPNRTRP